MELNTIQKTSMQPRVICFLLTIPFIFGNAVCQKGYVHHWERIKPVDGTWHINSVQAEPDSGWYEPDYSFTEWPTETMPLSYSTDTVKTGYMASSFTITDRDSISAMLFTAACSGGFVLYLNGHEVARSNMAGSFNHPPITDTALYPPSEKTEDYLVNHLRFRYALVQGTNTVAVQLHQYPQSVNLSLDLKIYVGKTSAETVYLTPEDTFSPPPTFAESSNLPIITINTEESINDSARVSGTMGITFDENSRNLFSGSHNHFNGNISIKYRGQSSLEFPKKSMSIETQTVDGSNNNVSLIGMPSENDWVLYAPYSDKSLIRNALTYKTFEKMGHYAPRFRFVELNLNTYYYGVYLLTEKIKRDKNRVDISNLGPLEIWGDDLTGGYIISNDKGAVIGENAWRSSVDADDYGYRNTVFSLEYPDHETVAKEQLAYIKTFCDSMETSLLNVNYTNGAPSYLNYINIDSWIDKFIITELCKDVDSYRYSEYMYKHKDSKGGKLFMGPVWDYNTGYGNLNYGEGAPWEPEGWMIGSNSNQIFWYYQLMEDDYFQQKLSIRWEALRSDILDTDNMLATVDSFSAIVQEAQVRNHYQWNTLGRYVWSNNFVADTYDEEIAFMKNWITDRLDWLDENMPAPISVSALLQENTEAYAYPTVFSQLVQFYWPNDGRQYSISISSMRGTVIANLGPLYHSRTVWEPVNLSAGTYIYTIYSQGKIVFSGSIQKQ